MRLPEIERLHATAIEKLEGMRDGRSRDGFGALVDAARYFAIAEVCAAVRKDLEALTPAEHP